MRRIAVLLAGMLFSTMAIGTASAHAELLSMTPESGSTVTDALTSVTLTFGEDVQTLGTTVVVIDPTGNEVQSGMTVQGPAVTLSIGELTTAGEYHVNFRVNSADSHIIEGSEVFTYDGPVASPMPVAVATVAGGGDDDGGEGEFGEGGGEGLEGAGGMIGLGLLAIIVVGGLAYAMTLRKKN